MRDYLFKDCITWKKEIRLLWKQVTKAMGESSRRIRGEPSGKIAGSCRAEQVAGAALRPGNCSVRRLLEDRRCIGAVLNFFEEHVCGKA